MRLVKVGSLAAEIEKREKNAQKEKGGGRMKLVNMDDIRWCDQFDHDGNLKPYKIAYSDEMPPTIEAIPIKFIWDFMDKIEEEIAQTDDSAPRMSGLCARHNALRALLRAWKEEEKKND